MSFNDIKGHVPAISFLKSSIRSRRFANAYIFCGPDGVGKKLTAVNFAKAVNCLSPDETCGGCSSCIKIDSSNHPDVRLLIPQKDGASVKIDDVRGIIKDIGLKPYEARSKIYIIDEAGSLTEEAANALLKTLEEPSPNSILILIAESVAQLSATIRSRCQVVKFFPLDTVMLEDMLVELHDLDRVKAHVLARVSCGRVGEALKLQSQDYFNKRESVIKACLSDSFLDLDFDKTAKRELSSLLNVMLTWYRDILVAKAGRSDAINIDKRDIIAREVKRLGFKRLDEILKRIILTQVYLEQNANPKLAMAGLGLAL